VIYSCTKEYSYEKAPLSDGYLLKDNNGDCFPSRVNGMFIQGHTTNSSNFMEVNVHASSPGSYAIYTDTLNGYSFKTEGNFSDTGDIQVKLACTGKPRAPGTNVFTIFYNTSICEASIAVADSSNNSVFTLSGNPATCMNSSVSGNYIKDVTLDTADKVKVEINVTTPGNYSISTDVVNGYSFSGSGLVTQTGLQYVYLQGSGTPMAEGLNTFTVRAAGTQACTFTVIILPNVPVNNSDYFPLTYNSHWYYDDVHNTAADSIRRTIVDSTIINGNLYKIMNEETRFWGTLKYYFRKSGGDYYEYTKVDKYTNSFQYGDPLYGELPFLKERLSTGDTWESAEFRAPASFGQILILKYSYKCEDANMTFVINGNAFTNVYKISVQPQLRSEGNGYGGANEKFYYYYAKGVGMISLEKTSLGNTTTDLRLRQWMVN
jgi:hypothetical protein